MMKIITVGNLGAVLLALAWSVIPRQASAGTPAGTVFTYQGELQKAGLGVSDACDFEFTLWEEEVIGLQIGATESASAVPVSDGVFTVKLDFGVGVFDGDARFLEIAVECPGDAGFTTLSPRQELTPTPYAIHAADCDFADIAAALVLPYEGTSGSVDPTFTLGNTGGGMALQVNKAGSGAGFGVNSTSNGVLASFSHEAFGDLLLVEAFDPLNPGTLIKARASGRGKVVDAENINALNSSEVVRVRSNGTGPGIDAELTQAANNKAVFKGVTNGAGQVLLAEQTGIGDAVKIDQSGPAGVALDVDVTNANNISDVLTVNTAGDGDVINAATTGAGAVVVAAINKANSAATVVDVLQNGLGNGVDINVTNLGSPGLGLEVLHSGIGPGIASVLSNVNNPAPAISALTFGRGPAMLAEIQNPASGAEALRAMTDGTGPAILADHQGNFGTAVFAHVGNPINIAPTIHAVTLGIGSAVEAEIQNGLNASHVIKAETIGDGQAIDAIISNPGSVAPVIKASGNHDGIGVFAHLHKPDNTGNAIVGYTAGTEAAGMFKNFNPGPGPFQFGILAGSDGFSAEAAGVVALGNGADSPGEPRAAALRIENGAVTVGGETRPAGTIDLDSSVWFAQESCESFCPDSCFHKHQVSQYAETVLFNDYLRGDSIILLTVRTTGDVGDDRTYYAQVSAQTTGSADIRVTGVGNDPGCLTPDPGENIAVHYFIINPLDDV